MKSTRIIFFTWLSWVVIVIAFQAWATARLHLRYPDRAQEWTTTATKEGYQKGHVYLMEPFMNEQVAWDSEYYLAIATGGYDDKRSPHLTPTGVITSAEGDLPPDTENARSISLSYAFFPFYPLMIRFFAVPLQILSLTPIATVTLAGVIVSALGALLGMFALFDLAKDYLDEEGAIRAAFYLIIFPTGFFLLQVYTEGLFVGLAFTCLALLKRKQLLFAAIFAVLATLTRAVGVALIIPLALTWLQTGDWMDLDIEWRQIIHQGIPLRPAYNFLLVLAPLIAFLIWKFSYLGLAFDFIESNFFGRGFLSLGQAFYAWGTAFRSMLSGAEPQHTAYYASEFLGIVIGIATCIAGMKISRELGWFSLAVMLISWGSGPAQGFHRYILAAPMVFIVLARWGRNPAFDRAWTVLSLMLMGLLATVFAFDMWVA